MKREGLIVWKLSATAKMGETGPLRAPKSCDKIAFPIVPNLEHFERKKNAKRT